MRWIVASLIVINILAFVYFQLFSNTPVNEASVNVQSSPQSSPSLTLLAEKQLDDIVPEEEQQPEQEQVAENSESPVAVPDLSETATDDGFMPSVNGEPICTLVGAFDRQLKAEYFVERLLALGLNSEIKNIAVEIETWYWLYLPPEPSRKEALRRLSEVQSRGIESYVVPTGRLANAISLGTFSKLDLAEAMKADVIKQGYKPEITEVPREQKEIWVFLPQGEAAKISPERWAELLSSQDYLQKRQNLCADVASA
jgi:cell division protein FtsN